MVASCAGTLSTVGFLVPSIPMVLLLVVVAVAPRAADDGRRKPPQYPPLREGDPHRGDDASETYDETKKLLS